LRHTMISASHFVSLSESLYVMQGASMSDKVYLRQ
jgi:hypothetical protein